MVLAVLLAQGAYCQAKGEGEGGGEVVERNFSLLAAGQGVLRFNVAYRLDQVQYRCSRQEIETMDFCARVM